MVDDLESWNGRADDNRYILQGKLSGDGIRKVMLLRQSPISSFVTAEKDLASGASESQMAYTTQQYFRSIQKVIGQIDDITKRDDVAISRYAKWFNNWADEIDGLHILNVDPTLLEFSQKLSESIRRSGSSRVTRSRLPWRSSLEWHRRILPLDQRTIECSKCDEKRGAGPWGDECTRYLSRDTKRIARSASHHGRQVQT